MFRYVVFILIVFASLYSCDDDIFETTPSTGQLTFSKDTVFLDTVFTNISSSTRTFKVYNKSSNHISIPSVRLSRGEQSFYRLNVNGEPGKSFENIGILPRDSIYIFVEATIDFEKVNDPLYVDEVIFDQGSNEQGVKLVTLVQDAYFLFPQRDAQGIKEKIVLGIDNQGEEITVEGFYLEGNTTWTSEKPYVIYGYVGVNKGNELTIEKGAHIYFHENSGLLVEKNGTLKINGTLDDKVIFEGDRLEPFYENIAGQWGTIWLRAGSKDHMINHAIIKNNIIGVLMDSVSGSNDPTLRIQNTEIYNTSNFGLFGRATHISGSNLVIGNNGQSSIACTLGGTYDFTHATFANFWSGGIREFPAVLVNNFQISTEADGSESIIFNDLLAANFTNCIIEGNQNIEFLMQENEQAGFEFNFANNLLRFTDPGGNFSNNPLYDFEDVSRYQNNILNGEADFKDVNENQLFIGAASDVISNANVPAAQKVPFDILGVNRVTSPDMGAYQHIIFEE
ncbi:hypothetical protein [Lutimonas vermicola]|uniref:Right handed beta helix domain-containing protein n=1 Tax=Lutimonas vermicola TaxID=414288 RepID=A0ABU9L052_9FLAO